MVVWVFSVIVIVGYLAIFWLKLRLSGEHLNTARLSLFLILNGFFVVPYLDIVYNDKFLFFGYHPEVVSEYPAVGWLSLLFAILHCFTFPGRN
ncbi:hypothetical protein [Pseudomonas fontis]|uniref:Uncharacterized protein n=1 Tax=Pseudomonas fontis TaxID=2942633 RepID=A0ABT5NWY6_9PSED|nr:hypothetical protein [Pseudomonas fontis]MDD0975078.1 hypothetical protein [Pseudomonas fontis]MDD0992701.1 hypothetical protein [Pseudomonas fontis]